MSAIIVGGDDLARAGCASIVEQVSEVQKIDTAETYADLEACIRERSPDWVIILGWGIDLRGLVNAIESAATIRPDLALIYSSSMAADPAHVVEETLSMNFRAILSSGSDLTVLRTMLTQRHSDVIVMSADVIQATMSINRSIPEVRARTPEINRVLLEKAELLAFIARGLSNKEIAREMNISEDHVKSRVRQTMHSLGLKKRTQLATIYLQGIRSHSTGNAKSNGASTGIAPQREQHAEGG